MFLLILFTIIVCLGVFAHPKLFRYAPTNPARRWCLLCNQQQEAYGRTYNNDWWWEDVGKVPDENCKCHKYSEYRR